MTTTKMITWQNGNATIDLHSDGTRVIEYDGELKLTSPLNIDIRVSERCSFGMKPNGQSICSFCHESATTNGQDGDLTYLKDKLVGLPQGTELAIGVNGFNDDLIDFFKFCKTQNWFVNITVNQGHCYRDLDTILFLIDNQIIHGLGISYRSGMKDIPEALLEYTNTVIHVIAGIDDIQEIKKLHNIKKILVLGEKDFGFNKGKVNLKNTSHVSWFRQLHELFNLFDVVSFDNLALEQLKVKRFVKNWEEKYQHEFSFYINAVKKYYSPSSRSFDQTPMDETTPIGYFKQLFN